MGIEDPEDTKAWIDTRIALSETLGITQLEAEARMRGTDFRVNGGKEVPAHHVPLAPAPSVRPRTRVEIILRAEGIEVPPQWAEEIVVRIQRELHLQFGTVVQALAAQARDESGESATWRSIPCDWRPRDTSRVG